MSGHHTVHQHSGSAGAGSNGSLKLNSLSALSLLAAQMQQVEGGRDKGDKQLPVPVKQLKAKTQKPPVVAKAKKPSQNMKQPEVRVEPVKPEAQRRNKIADPAVEEAKQRRAQAEKRYRKDLKKALTTKHKAFIQLCLDGRFAEDGIFCKKLQTIPNLGPSFGTFNKQDTILNGKLHSPYNYLLNAANKQEYTLWLKPKDNNVYYNARKGKKYITLVVNNQHVLLVEEKKYASLFGQK